MKTGLTDKVRKAAGTFDGPFTARELRQRLDVRTYKESGSLYGVIRDMKRAGEIRMVKPLTYEYIQRAKPRTKMDVIWHLVRSHRVFGAAEIERLSGAKRCTVREYLQCLTRLGYLRKVKCDIWQLVDDPGPQAPVNAGRCERLRKVRRRRKEGMR